MADEVVLYETKGHITYITMNRPEKLNAISPEVFRGLRQAFINFRDDHELRVAILTGAGNRAFSAGADLVRMSQRSQASFGEDYWYPAADTGYIEVWKPVIAAINGYCYAAAMNLMCMMTDIRIASENATFCYAEVLRGFSGAGQALGLIPRQVPYAIAMRWLLTGQVFDAQAAARYGLINEVVPQEQLMARAEEVAQEICELPPIALRAVKEAVVRGMSMDIPNAIRFANTVGVLTRYTEDAQEGPRAFAEKRKPAWRGR